MTLIDEMIVSTRAATAQLLDFDSQRNVAEKNALFRRLHRNIAIREDGLLCSFESLANRTEMVTIRSILSGSRKNSLHLMPFDRIIKADLPQERNNSRAVRNGRPKQSLPQLASSSIQHARLNRFFFYSKRN